MKSLFSLIFGLLIGSYSIAQCTAQITHLEGSATIDGTEITVTSEGAVSSFTSWCPESTTPYYIGNSATGRYIFSFNPPAEAVTVNFGALSNVDAGSEEIRLYVNGEHYPMTEVGDQDACAYELAELTPEGNARACEGCDAQGWINTTVAGSISTFEVENFYLDGSPAGSVVSVFFCETFVGLNEVKNLETNIFPNPASDQISVESNSFPAIFRLLDINGKVVQEKTLVTQTTLLDLSDLSQGYYIYTIISDDQNAVGKLEILK